MSRERRIRDEDGSSIYYNIDESDESDAVPSLSPNSGAGAGHLFNSVLKNVASKLTGKAAKKIAEKAIEKGAEKVGEKTGEKLGVLLGEKIYDRFRGDNPQKGDQIFKELQREQRNQKRKKPPPGDPQGTSHVVSQLKSAESSHNQERNVLSTKSIAQQFEELLAL